MVVMRAPRSVPEETPTGAVKISMMPASGWKQWALQSLEMPLLVVTRALECKLNLCWDPRSCSGGLDCNSVV